MPPKIKITREMIVGAGFELVRENGIEGLTVRTIADRLGCSTQPILYGFKTAEEIRRAVYDKVNLFHTEYLMNLDDPNGVMLGIGLNYIRFAIREPNLFRFLFQSGYAAENSLLEMVNSEELIPVLSAMRGAMGMNMERTKEVFLTIAMFAHGYASIIANNSLEYDEKLVAEHLKRAYKGAVFAAREESDGTEPERS